MSLFIKTNTRKIGGFEFRKFGVFKSISDVLSILKKFIFMDILAPKVTLHEVKSGLIITLIRTNELARSTQSGKHGVNNIDDVLLALMKIRAHGSKALQ